MVEILKVNDRAEILVVKDKRGKLYWLSFCVSENRERVVVMILRNIRRRPSFVFFKVYDSFSIDEFISDLKDSGLHPLVEIIGTEQIERKVAL